MAYIRDALNFALKYSGVSLRVKGAEADFTGISKENAPVILMGVDATHNTKVIPIMGCSLAKATGLDDLGESRKIVDSIAPVEMVDNISPGSNTVFYRIPITKKMLRASVKYSNEIHKNNNSDPYLEMSIAHVIERHLTRQVIREMIKRVKRHM